MISSLAHGAGQPQRERKRTETAGAVVVATTTVGTQTDTNWQVDFLLRRRVCRADQSVSYLARWVGLGPRQDSWVCAEALNPQKVREYKVWYRGELRRRESVRVLRAAERKRAAPEPTSTPAVRRASCSRKPTHWSSQTNT